MRMNERRDRRTKTKGEREREEREGRENVDRRENFRMTELFGDERTSI